MKEQLQQLCLRYFLRHGVAGVSLRPLAEAVGTSARMLLHYFGSKDELVAAVMANVRTRLQSLIEPAKNRRGNAAEVMIGFWERATKPQNLPYLRLLFEVHVLALQRPRRFRKYFRETSESWLALIERTLPPGPDRTATATLYVAVVDGLLLELLSTGDARRTRRALNLFVAGVAAGRRGETDDR